MLEVKSIVTTIVRNFKIVATERTRNMKYRSDMVLRPIDGVYVKLEKRMWRLSVNQAHPAHLSYRFMVPQQSPQTSTFMPAHNHDHIKLCMLNEMIIKNTKQNSDCHAVQHQLCRSGWKQRVHVCVASSSFLQPAHTSVPHRFSHHSSLFCVEIDSRPSFATTRTTTSSGETFCWLGNTLLDFDPKIFQLN